MRRRDAAATPDAARRQGRRRHTKRRFYEKMVRDYIGSNVCDDSGGSDEKGPRKA